MPECCGDAANSYVKYYILKHENLSNEFIFSKDGGWDTLNSKNNYTFLGIERNMNNNDLSNIKHH